MNSSRAQFFLRSEVASGSAGDASYQVDLGGSVDAVAPPTQQTNSSGWEGQDQSWDSSWQSSWQGWGPTSVTLGDYWPQPTVYDITRNRKKEVNVIDNGKGPWEKVVLKMDSGAVDTCIPVKCAQTFELRQTKLSKAGIGYIAAS